MFRNLIIVTILLSLLACGKKEEIKYGGIKIGFLIKTMQEERYKKDKEFFIKRADELGAEVLFSSSDNSEELQNKLFNEMLSADLDVIVLQAVNTKRAVKLIEKAKKQGVKVIGYDSMIVEAPLSLVVMHDSWSVGRLQGEKMVEWFKEERGSVAGEVVLLMGKSGDSNANAMSLGVLEAISKNRELKLIGKYSHESWSSEESKATVKRLLKRNKNIDAFICNNSNLAKGVVEAFDELGKDSSKVFIAGADADLENIKYLINGKQKLEIYKPIKILAERAAETAVKLAKNGDREVDAYIKGELIYNGYDDMVTVLVPVYVVEKESVDDIIVKSGFWSKKEIYR